MWIYIRNFKILEKITCFDSIPFDPLPTTPHYVTYKTRMKRSYYYVCFHDYWSVFLLQTPQTNLKSLTPARKQPPSTISQPSSTKKSSRRLWKTNDQNPTSHPLASLARRINHENVSPNVQHWSIAINKDYHLVIGMNHLTSSWESICA